MPSELWERVKSIFHAAIEMEASERAAYLDEACRADPELRREVDWLLAFHETPRSLFDLPDTPTLRQGAAGGERMFQADDVLASRFRILRFAGGGGMGEVYEAEDLNLRERLALKTLRPELAFDDASLVRFRREIQLARRVTHRNVCRIFDGGRHRKGDRELHFLTMEYVDGETLSAYLKRKGRLSPEEALPILRQMAEALAALHEANIVHRDLKSANVILETADAGDPRVVVTDFGLARPALLGSRSESLATNTSQILGTPDYAAPEQLSSEKVGPYSDVYAFGVVAYEMLCGRRPFSSDSMAKLIVEKLTQAPVRPTEIVPELDPRWESFVLACMERKPQDRVASPREILRLLDELAREDGGELALPVAGVRADSGNQTGAWRQRWVWPATLAAATAAVAAAGYQSPSVKRQVCSWLPGSSWFCELPADKDLAILPFTVRAERPEDEALANGLLAFLHRSFFELYPDKAEMCVHIRGGRRSATTYGAQLALTGELAVDGDSLRLESRIEDASNDAENPEGPRRLVRLASVSVDRSRTGAFVEGALLELARKLELEYPEEEWDAWRQRLPEDDVALAAYLRGVGLLEAGQSEVGPKAEPELIRAAEAFSAAVDRSYAFALAHAGLGDAYRTLYEKVEERSWAAKARNAYQEAAGLDPDLAGVQSGLAGLSLALGDTEAALESFEATTRLDPFDHDTQVAYAAALGQAGERERTEQLWETVIDQRPECWYGYNEIARFYLDHGRREEAARALQTIVRLAPTHAAAHHNLAFVYIKIGRHDDAIERAADSVKFGIGPMGYSTLGRAYQAKGCSTDALVNFRYSLADADRVERETGRPYATRYLLWKNLGDALDAAGRKEEAQDAFGRMLAFGQEYLAERPRHRVALGHFAFGLARLGRTEGAVDKIEAALSVAPDNEETLLRAATVYELVGDRKRALALLEDAFRNGLYVHEIQGADSLDALRASPQYRKMLSGLGYDDAEDPGSTIHPGSGICPESREAGQGLRKASLPAD